MPFSGSTSDPEHFVGSYASTSSIRDAIISHNRSQYYANSQPGVPSSYSSGFAGPLDAELAFDEEDEDDLPTPRPGEHDTVEEMMWDANPAALLQPPPETREIRGHNFSVPTGPRPSEHTPLLHHASGDLRRRVSTVSLKPRPVGRSTFRQTLFNAGALLLGIGMLSEPLAFACAGWGMGTFLIIFYGYLTCYTAKFLGKIVISDARIRSYADIGLKAFGSKSATIISVIFCLEVFTVSVILETLYADSLNAVIPTFSSDTYKLVSVFVLIPCVFLPLSTLSYTSLMGIVSTLCLTAVIFIDGLSKTTAPGSLIEPAETHLLFANWKNLGMAFGLFMAGFGAHAAMPSLAADMEDPSRFDEAMNYAFTFTTVFYALIGAAGYLMFGDDVSDEISQNLLGIPGYSTALNKIVLWMLVIASLTKFPLTSRPFNITLEVVLGIDPAHRGPPHEHGASSKHIGHEVTLPTKQRTNYALKRFFFITERACFVLISVAVSILLPDFSAMMAILGSFTAFLLCVIGPIGAKLSLEGRNVKDIIFLVIATAMAAWGSCVAIMSE
ncbi:unnamed protein product [Peniophora sp. CBMAI 1063]|nr:unnamed protein product [Peniophora sp. CBMAI 1063]